MKLLLLLVLGALGAATAEKVVCYFSSWAVYRPGDGKFDVDQIDPFLCTHIMFSFTGLSNHTWEIEVLDPWNELCQDEEGGNNCAFNRTVALKKKNPELIVMVAIGGWNEGSVDYSVMSEDPQKRKIFINSAVALITKYGFDGLDFDWEYPAARGGDPVDKENFVILMKEMRAAFDQFNPPLLISGAFAAGKETIDDAYDILPLVDVFDLFHIMAYDYHGAWENFTHHNSPLCGHYLDYDEFIYFNVEFTVDYYLSLGVPKDKFVLGTATYGRCYTLNDIEEHGIWDIADTPGQAGPYIRIDGTLGFNEVCERIRDDKTCKIVHDPSLHEPYFYCSSDNIWCSYDDVDSLYLKARLAKNKGLAGVMVWQIDTDDFKPKCYQEPFSLIKSIKNALDEPAGGDLLECQRITPIPTTPESTTTPSTTIPTTTTPTTTTTNTPPPSTTPSITTPIPTIPTSTPEPTTISFETTTHGDHGRPDCSKHEDGETFSHSDCNMYWECVFGSAVLEMCSPGTLYDDVLKICNWEGQVDTSECRLWDCQVDNTYFPAPDCDKYYRCFNGAPHLETCPDGEYWNQNLKHCDFASRVDTSGCNIV